MGFFDKLKKVFDAGGLSVDVDVPQTFRWNDGVIPVDVRISGHESEPRTINSVEVVLREDDRDDDRGNNSRRPDERNVVAMTFNEPFTLQPGEMITRTYELQLSFSDALDDVSTADKVAGWLGTAADLLETGRNISLGGSEYQIIVTPDVEGARMRRGTTRRIRRLGMGEVQFGTSLR